MLSYVDTPKFTKVLHPHELCRPQRAAACDICKAFWPIVNETEVMDGCIRLAIDKAIVGAPRRLAERCDLLDADLDQRIPNKAIFRTEGMSSRVLCSLSILVLNILDT